jgi:hypothetical protein
MSERNVRVVPPSDEMLKYVNELKDVLGKYPDLDPIHMVAGTAQFMGLLIAVQDQTKYTSQEIMNIIMLNIEMGNTNAIQSILGTGGTMQ